MKPYYRTAGYANGQLVCSQALAHCFKAAAAAACQRMDFIHLFIFYGK